MKKNLKVIILAAGRGKRLGSETADCPKVMRLADGKPLLGHVLSQIPEIEKKDVTIIVGYKREAILEAFGEYSFAVQEEQKGTGHAVMCAEKDFEEYEGNVLVLSGDMPLVSNKTLEDLCNFHENNKNACSVLSVENKNESSFGRIIRNADGSFAGIVEKKDCTPEQLASTELNAGIYVFDSKLLFKYLHNINSDNAQGEYYITDVPAVLIKNSFAVDAFKIFDLDETLGVNTVEDLEMVEKVLQSRK